MERGHLVVKGLGNFLQKRAALEETISNELKNCLGDSSMSAAVAARRRPCPPALALASSRVLTRRGVATHANAPIRGAPRRRGRHIPTRVVDTLTARAAHPQFSLYTPSQQGAALNLAHAQMA